MNQACTDTAISKPHGQSPYGLAQNRLRGFGMTMIVMGASFILYYLGLFGSVDGPLTPATIGSKLAATGVTRFHVITTLLIILILAICWNWVVNLIHFVIGRRLTCTAGKNGTRNVCGSTAKRTRRVSRQSGKTVIEYVCAHGHRRPDVHFHPISKNALSHVIWLTCLAFLVLAICYA